MGGQSPQPQMYVQKPDIAPLIAILGAQQQQQNAGYNMMLQEQPFLFDAARQIGTAQQEQGGKVLGAATDLAKLQQGLGNSYLDMLGLQTGNQSALEGGYLNAQSQSIAAQQALNNQYLGQYGNLAANQQQTGRDYLGAATNAVAAQQDLESKYLGQYGNLVANQQQTGRDYLGAAEAMAAGNQALGNRAIQAQSEAAKGQQQLAQNILNISSSNAPEAQQFNADQTSKEAQELGMANLSRERQMAQLVDPKAEEMRAALGEKIQNLTSPAADKEWLNTLLKQGIMRSGATGVPISSSAGGAAYGDLSYEQKRQRDIQNLQIQQQYAAKNTAEVQAAMAQGMSLEQAKQATEAKNAAQRNSWLANVINQASNLGQVTSQAQQNVLNLTNNVVDRSMAQQNALMAAGQNLANQGYAAQGNLLQAGQNLSESIFGRQQNLMQASQALADRGYATEGNLLQAGQNLASNNSLQQQNLLQSAQGLASQDFARQYQLGQTAYGIGSQALGAQSGLLGSLQNLNNQALNTNAGLLGQLGQTTMGNAQSMMGMQNQGYGNLMGAVMKGQQDQQNYQNMLYQGAVQNAASQNAMTGAGIGALGSVAGMGLLALCVVAREVYGEQNPAWVEFRSWLLSKGSPRRVARYAAHGPKIAKYISTRPSWKARVKDWMDRCRLELAIA
jgi:hypothetical protein